MTTIAQIIEAQKHIIANPINACVNTESSFVKQRLQELCFNEAATLYWNFVCSYSNKSKYITDTVVIEQQNILESKKLSIPAWGISGT